MAAPLISIYSASKAAAQHFGRVMAKEWAKFGISVNVVNPGYIQTDIVGSLFENERGKAMLDGWPRGRLTEAEDLNDIMTLLVSDEARRITGSCFTVDDGQSL